MPQIKGDVHLVGSVPLDTAKDVFETCAKTLGGRLGAMPDGEVGHRVNWIVCQAVYVFNGHPQIDLVHRPAPIDGKEQWLPKNYADQWKFAVKAGAGPVTFDDLKYAAWAIELYGTFAEMRDRGIIPRDVRFQVCLPTPLAGLVPFFGPEDSVRLQKAYEAAMLKEVEKICARIPHDDLSIQWDVAVETGSIEQGQPMMKIGGDAFQRWADEAGEIGPPIPRDVALGYHICYGDFNHRHSVEPRDLSVSIRMLNEAAARAKRSLDFVHMPVPINRDDDAYFAPLRDLQVGDARVYLGLVHFDDGVEGTLNRARTAKKYLADFGVATECGFGRRRPQTLPDLLRIHRDVAARLTSL